MPLITIIAVCYNHQEYVAQCLDSIREQTYRDIQLIIVDDKSTDKSVEAIQAWIKKNLFSGISIFHDENKGLNKSLNEALSYSKGVYIKPISTDDILEPHYLETVINQFNKEPTIDIIYTDMFEISETGSLVTHSYAEKYSLIPHSGFIFNQLLSTYFITTPSVIFKKKVSDSLNGYDEQLVFEDYDFMLRASRDFKVHYIHCPLVKYRINFNSLSRKPRDAAFILSYVATHFKHVGLNPSTDFIIFKKILINTFPLLKLGYFSSFISIIYQIINVFKHHMLHFLFLIVKKYFKIGSKSE